MVNIDKLVGTTVRKLRRAQTPPIGLTAVARAMNCGRGNVSLLERGKHHWKVEALVQVAPLLGLKPGELLEQALGGLKRVRREQAESAFAGAANGATASAEAEDG